MIYLISAMLSNISIIILICIILFFIIFVLKRIIEKERDFIKRINWRYFLKYVILFMLILGMILVIACYILIILFPQTEKYLMIFSYAFLFISIGWAFIFEKINIYINLSKDEIVEQYILLFTKNKMSNNKYLEVITWFSVWNHKCFRLKNDCEQEIDQLITKLELLLRPDDNGLCLAAHHKKDFLILCNKLKKCEIKEKLKEIENAAIEMGKKTSEKYVIFSLSLDHNILMYLVIIALHIVASILVSDDNIKNIFGNILFYVPSDILIILVYKGIINEREVNKK